MTSNPKGHDPARWLDGPEPPDRWDDVVARAESPADTMESPSLIGAGGRHRRPAPLLAAAAVLAVVALVAGIALALRGGDDDNRIQDVAAGPGDDPPTAIWGHTWQLTRIVRDGKDQPVIPARLDTTEEGSATVKGCNDTGGPVLLNGDRLIRDGDWFSTRVGCFGPSGEQDDVLYRLFRRGPIIEVRDGQLTLTAGATKAVFIDSALFDPPTAIWGRTFTVTRLVVDGQDMSPKASRGVPVHLRFKTVPDANYGIVEIIGQAGCANQNPVSVHRDVLETVMVELAKVPVCEFDVTEVAANRILVTQPIIQLRGDQLVLRAGTSSIEAVDKTGPGADDPAEPAVGPSPTTTTSMTSMTSMTLAPSTTVDPPSTTATSPVTGGRDDGPPSLRGRRPSH